MSRREVRESERVGLAGINICIDAWMSSSSSSFPLLWNRDAIRDGNAGKESGVERRGEKQKGTSRHSGTEYHEVVTQLWNGVIGGYEPAARGAIPRQRGSRRRKLVEEDRFITRGDGGGGGRGGMERGSWPRTGWSQPRYLPFRRSVFARAPPPPSLLPLLHLLPPSYPLLQRFILPIEYADEECGGTHRCAVLYGIPWQTVPNRAAPYPWPPVRGILLASRSAVLILLFVYEP